MKVPVPLIALLLVALACSTSASRGRMLLGCEDDCEKGYENNVAQCIAQTALGTPPMPVFATAMAQAYVKPEKDAFDLAEVECRRLQTNEYNKCKAACKPDCDAVKAKCLSAFDEGTLMEVYCRKEKGC